jgi:hypothetical protein
MTRPQIADENRKYSIGNTRGMRILRLMANGELMTCPHANQVLGGSIQTARNVVCALVTQKLAELVTARGRNQSATYRITEAGRLRLLSITAATGTDDELDADEAAERAYARSRIETNIAWAKTMVPNSVWALGAIRSAPARATEGALS